MDDFFTKWAKKVPYNENIVRNFQRMVRKSTQLGSGGNGVVEHQQIQDFLPLLGMDGGK